jgi:hypothetical protein
VRLQQLPARGACLRRVASPLARLGQHVKVEAHPLSQEWSALGGAARTFATGAKRHGGRRTLDARFYACPPLHHTCRAHVQAGMSLRSARRVTQSAPAVVCAPCARRCSSRRACTSRARAHSVTESELAASARLPLVRRVVVSSSAAQQRNARATERLQPVPPHPAVPIMSVARYRVCAPDEPECRRKRRSDTCSAHCAQLAATPNLRRCAPAAWRRSMLTSGSAAGLHALDRGARRGCARCSTPSPPGASCANADVVLDMPAQNGAVHALSPNSPAFASMLPSGTPATDSA